MTPIQQVAPAPRPRRHAFAAFFQPRMLLMLMLGFSAGLPFLLTFSTLSIWTRESGVTLREIGAMSYVGLAYTIKFLWAPALDHLRVPVLDRLLGRRRAWMVVSQAVIAVGLVGIGLQNPGEQVWPLVAFALVVAFASATQDIAIDAWRIEAAPKEEQGAMAAAYQLGYRFALMASGAGALYIAEYWSWAAAYAAMALLMGVGVAAALLSPRLSEEHSKVAGEETVAAAVAPLGALAGVAAFLYRTVVAPFVDFFAAHKWTALLILALIGLYRIPDFVMGVMANPFYVDSGFDKTDIANVSKIYGVWIGIAGAFAGGWAVAQFGNIPTLIAGGIVASASNLVFAWMAGLPEPDVGALTLAISVDNFSGGFAGTALIAYMSSLTNTAFTATQYALFSSFYALPGKLLGGQSGVMVEAMGYQQFFSATAAMGIPAILLTLAVVWLARRGAPVAAPSPAAASRSAT